MAYIVIPFPQISHSKVTHEWRPYRMTNVNLWSAEGARLISQSRRSISPLVTLAQIPSTVRSVSKPYKNLIFVIWLLYCVQWAVTRSSQLTVGSTFPFRSVQALWPLFLWIHSSFCFMKLLSLYEFVLINKVAYRTQASWIPIASLPVWVLIGEIFADETSNKNH